MELREGLGTRAGAAPVICHGHVAAAVPVAALEVGLDDRVLGTAAPLRGEEAVNRNPLVRGGQRSNVAPGPMGNYSAAAHLQSGDDVERSSVCVVG